jgi:hypothetical protein
VIIKNPEQCVVGFKGIQWLTGDEPSPKKLLRTHLRKLLASLTAVDDEEAPSSSEDGENQDEDQDEDEDNDEGSEDEDLDFLTANEYTNFCISEDGDVLLMTYDNNAPNIFFTGKDAEGLVTMLRAKLMDRASKLSKLAR